MVLNAVKYQPSTTNYKWSAGNMPLTDAEVEASAQICEYGLGNRDMGTAVIDRWGNYKYRQETTQFVFELKPEYANIKESHVTHHIWRVNYLSKAVLSNICEHATADACAPEEKDLFMSRQDFDHPADYSLPKIFIEHRIGPFYFLDAWKNPEERRRPIK